MATEIITCRECGYEAPYRQTMKGKGKIEFPMENYDLCKHDQPMTCPEFTKAINLPARKIR